MNWRKLFARAMENWPAKVLSLALAIILFVFHRMNSLETRSFFAPLVIERLNAMMPSSQYPRMIRVSLRGEATSIYSILEGDIVAYIDMDGINLPGTYNVPVQWRKKGTAEGIEPLQISVDPPEITFSLDHKISKFVPLGASFHGQVEEGFNLTSFSLEPAQIIVDGPAALMSGISELMTEAIDLDGRRSAFSATVNILNVDPLLVIRGDGSSEFRGNISRIIPVRNIPNVPIAVTGLGEGFSGEPEIKAANIHLEGDNLDAVNSFDPPEGFLRIDCSGITEPGIYVLRVQTGTAGNITFRSEPNEVTIQIELIEPPDEPEEEIP